LNTRFSPENKKPVLSSVLADFLSKWALRPMLTRSLSGLTIKHPQSGGLKNIGSACVLACGVGRVANTCRLNLALLSAPSRRERWSPATAELVPTGTRGTHVSPKTDKSEFSKNRRFAFRLRIRPVNTAHGRPYDQFIKHFQVARCCI
jgi:hypothetical protein